MKNLSKNQRITIIISFSTLVLSAITAYLTFFYEPKQETAKQIVGTLNSLDGILSDVNINISLSNPGNQNAVIVESKIIGWFGSQPINALSQDDGLNWDYFTLIPIEFSPELPITIRPDDIQIFSVTVDLSPIRAHSSYPTNSAIAPDTLPNIMNEFSNEVCGQRMNFYIAFIILTQDVKGISTQSIMPISLICINQNNDDFGYQNLNSPIYLLNENYVIDTNIPVTKP